MMAMISSQAGYHRGQELIDLYKSVPYDVMVAIAFALHELPQRGSQFGPALRVLRSPVSNVAMLYGALSTDIRDFLKLRFRVTGLTGIEEAPTEAFSEALSARSGEALGAALEGLHEDQLWPAFSYLVNYLISELDALSRTTSLHPEESLEQFHERVLQLRDVVRAYLRWIKPDWYNNYVDRAFQQPAE
jgi:hypothetical protein